MSGGMGSIYCLVDPRNGTPRYVGKTVQAVSQRVYQHVHDSRHARKDGHVHRWIRQLLELELRPDVRILTRVAVDELNDAERTWIAVLRGRGHDLTNLTAGGDGGAIMPTNPQATSARRSDAMRRKWQDAEYRKKVTTAITGKQRSETARENYRAAAARRTQDVYDKIGEALRGVTKPGAAAATRAFRAADREQLTCDRCGRGPFIGRCGLGRHKAGGRCEVR